MKIVDNSMVTINYELTDDQGQILDSSKGGDPLSFIQGKGLIIPSLEKALEGRIAGDSFKVRIAPEEGYGVIEEDLIQAVPSDRFDNHQSIRVGQEFQVHAGHGDIIVRVIKVEEDAITVDGNHPLAGQTLNFDVSVVEVRQATQDEIGMAEGCGGGCDKGHCDQDHGAGGGCCGGH